MTTSRIIQLIERDIDVLDSTATTDEEKNYAVFAYDKNISALARRAENGDDEAAAYLNEQESVYNDPDALYDARMNGDI